MPELDQEERTRLRRMFKLYRRLSRFAGIQWLSDFIEVLESNPGVHDPALIERAYGLPGHDGKLCGQIRDEIGVSLMYMAEYKDDVRWSEAWIKHGAPCSLQLPHLAPLSHEAFERCNETVLTQLVEAGVPVGKELDQGGFLHKCIEERSLGPLVSMALRFGADPNLEVAGQGLPLARACVMGYYDSTLDVVQSLIEHGADVAKAHQCKRVSESPLVEAMISKSPRTMALLIQHGAPVLRNDKPLVPMSRIKDPECKTVFAAAVARERARRVAAEPARRATAALNP